MKPKIVTNIDLLLKHRRQLNLTQEDVAELTVIGPSTYRMIEGGHRRPSVAVAMKLGELLGFNWWELYIKVEGTPETEDSDSQE